VFALKQGCSVQQKTDEFLLEDGYSLETARCGYFVNRTTGEAAAAAAAKVNGYQNQQKTPPSRKYARKSNNIKNPNKTAMRAFSTFVSKRVRQEFGSSFLAVTQIRELDQHKMEQIKSNFNNK
jgi:hypothetical protein